MRRTRLLSAAFRRAALALLALGPGAWGTPPPAGPAPLTAATPPIRLQRFALPGPLAGVLAQVDLKDPRVRV